MRLVLVCALLMMTATARAQAIKNEPPTRHFSDEEVAAIPMPDLNFSENPEDVENYDKYFYFSREATGFDEAYADIKECDALASGIRVYTGGSATIPYPYAYTVAGAIGGAIGSAMVDAIFGSAERRRIRRVNMRNCMGFKGYARYGMEREHWQAFNFEEGNGALAGEKRETYLLMQAKVASTSKPAQQVLEP